MITFNNKTLPEWVSITGIDFQSLNLSILEYETKRRVGNIDAGIERGGVNINLTAFIEPVEELSIHEQADILKEFLMGDNWKVSELIIHEQPNKFYKSRVANFSEITDNFTHGEATITFYSADPKKYDVSETTLTSVNGELLINYTGLEKASVVIDINVINNVTNLEIEHLETDRKMIIMGSFSSGQTITLDTVNRNVLIDGISAKGNMAFESKWLFLEKGPNTITCSSPDNITNNFGIKYRKAD